MLYASMALVTAGVVLLLYSLFFENEISRSRPPSDRYVPPMDGVTDKKHDLDPDISSIAEELDAELEDFTLLNSEEMLDDVDLLDLDIDETDDIPVDIHGKNADTSEEHPMNEVVLYEDPERISVDVAENDAEINVENLARFTRVGEGTVDIFKDGINLRIGKRLYRFDFAKIDNVYAGRNHIVLTLKGTGNARVMVFKNSKRIPEHIISQLNNLISAGT